jgi:hypothetical protein
MPPEEPEKVEVLDTTQVTVMAQERFKNVVQYQRDKVSSTANRAVGNNPVADSIDKEMAALRYAVALIDKDYPEAKNIMKKLMAAESK